MTVRESVCKLHNLGLKISLAGAVLSGLGLMIGAPVMADTLSLQTDSGNTNPSFPRMTFTVYRGHTQGESQLTWVMNSSSAQGAQVSVYVLGLPTAPIVSDFKLSVSDVGGSATVTADGLFNSGVSLTALPQTQGSAINMCRTNHSGIGNFITKFTLDAPFEHGSGTVSGTLFLTAISL